MTTESLDKQGRAYDDDPAMARVESSSCPCRRRNANDRIDQVRVRMDVPEHAAEQRQTVADREQAHVLDDILQPVQEEDDAH